jgi:hypothetical protein
VIIRRGGALGEGAGGVIVKVIQVFQPFPSSNGGRAANPIRNALGVRGR